MSSACACIVNGKDGLFYFIRYLRALLLPHACFPLLKDSAAPSAFPNIFALLKCLQNLHRFLLSN